MMQAADLVENTASDMTGFLPSQPPRSARWLDGCREHWRPESSAVPGPQIGHNFTDAQRLCRTTRTPKYAHCFGNALSDRYLVLEPTLGRNIVALDDVIVSPVVAINQRLTYIRIKSSMPRSLSLTKTFNYPIILFIPPLPPYA